MLKLINLSTYNFDLERFNYDSEKITNFLEKNHMDGIELLNPIGWKEEIIPKKIVKGAHLRNYPTWLHFWNNDKDSLLKEFKSMELVEKYYGGSDRKAIIEYYKKEIEMASRIGLKYVVFHVSHVEVEHIYKYNFTYSDEEVIDAAAELINEVFRDIDTDVELLFENLWWPGLTMLSKDMALRLLDKVEYQNKGFMLDTGHLMNTNVYLKNEKQGIEYIIDTIDNLGELRKYIKGIHLHCSLSGEYVMEQINNNKAKEITFSPISEEVFMHVFNIDNHKPFTDSSAKNIIEFIKPKYLVYELISNSIIELEEYIKIQNKAIG